MSEPSYRINTEHTPDANYQYLAWTCRVTRLSDGAIIATVYGTTEADAIDRAQKAIRIEASQPQPGRVLFASEDGEITDGTAPTPESLKAS